MKRLLSVLFSIVVLSAYAQNHHMHNGTMNMDSIKQDSNYYDMASMHSVAQHPMPHAYSLNLPMTRNGSGTGWLPDASPMYGYMKHADQWMFMFHGNLFVRYNKQDLFDKGSRGNAKWDAPNYIMAMAQRKIGKRSLFHANVMLSADALIAGGSGYPLLFQTGESWKGLPLVDRQHPHDLFSELSVSYSYALSKKADLFAYLGYPGEPALGSVAFMHRPSALFMPDAPISHHWNDGTHITFGVATIGFRYGKFKLEGSSFTGREPDEGRYDFDKPRFDSWSGRLSYNPSAWWALQVSHGFVKSPEALHTGEDVNRTTASAVYTYPLHNRNFVYVTVLWGQNNISGEDPSNATLLEATIKLDKLVFYTRYEWTQKSGEELNLVTTPYNAHTLYGVHTATLGTGYDLFSVAGINTAIGAQLSIYSPAKTLRSLYSNTPVGGQIYLHFYPRRMM